MSDVIRVKDLSKHFGDLKAVNQLSFTVGEGQVYGFLGQNGAGKSTTIRMLMTLIEPTGGEIEIFGMSLRKHRKEILRQTGAIIEKPDLYKYLTAKENVRIFSRLSGDKATEKQIMDQLALVGLAGRADSKVKTYSQGMKQRLGLACALVHNPGLIILDEPSNGLDPQGIADMRQLILHLSRDQHKTLVVSSHLLSEMEMVADHMIIIHKGEKVVEGKVSELLDPEKTMVELLTPDIQAAITKLKNGPWQNALKEPVKGTVRLECNRNEIPALNRFLVEQDIAVQSLRPMNSLEDYFLSLTKV